MAYKNKETWNAYQRKYRREHSEIYRSKDRQAKQKCVDYKGGRCAICGYNKCLAALDFHHINPNEKETAIAGIFSLKQWEYVKQELDKCICVCSNCHRELHYYNKSIVSPAHKTEAD